MKIQCQLCKEIVELDDFRSSSAGIDITCAACGEQFFVAAPAAPEPAADEPPAPDDPRMRCPKCDDEQPAADACRACGLAAANFADFAARADEASPVLAGLWQRCVDDWDQPATHEAFIKGVAGEAAYAFGARKYRQAIRDRPRDARARSGLDRLTRMAEATLLSSAAGRKGAQADEPYKSVVLLMVALVALVGIIGGVYLLFRGRDSAPSARPPAPIHLPVAPRSHSPRTR